MLKNTTFHTPKWSVLFLIWSLLVHGHWSFIYQSEFRNCWPSAQVPVLNNRDGPQGHVQFMFWISDCCINSDKWGWYVVSSENKSRLFLSSYIYCPESKPVKCQHVYYRKIFLIRLLMSWKIRYWCVSLVLRFCVCNYGLFAKKCHFEIKSGRLGTSH